MKHDGGPVWPTHRLKARRRRRATTPKFPVPVPVKADRPTRGGAR